MTVALTVVAFAAGLAHRPPGGARPRPAVARGPRSRRGPTSGSSGRSRRSSSCSSSGTRCRSSSRPSRARGSRPSWRRPWRCRSTRAPTRRRSSAAACSRSTTARSWRRGRSALSPWSDVPPGHRSAARPGHHPADVERLHHDAQDHEPGVVISLRELLTNAQLDHQLDLPRSRSGTPRSAVYYLVLVSIFMVDPVVASSGATSGRRSAPAGAMARLRSGMLR